MKKVPERVKLTGKASQPALKIRPGMGEPGPKGQGSAAMKKAQAGPNWPEEPGKRRF